MCHMIHSLLHIFISDMAHPYAWHDSLMCVKQLIDMCDMTLDKWSDSFICVTWCVTWYIDMCHMIHPSLHICILDMTHPYVSHGSFIRVTQLIDMYDMNSPWSHIRTFETSHLHVWHDSLIYVIWCVAWFVDICHMIHPSLHICILDMTHPYVSHGSCSHAWHD